ncbi:DUF1631 family protein [Hydrogenophaga sp. 5NK40-0174]|uniref:DUF1631 family protein n=1 Tax=Hydrogenophaga sp. 5NK40-0174 TaxID=3127649 RepID=UPI0031058266
MPANPVLLDQCYEDVVKAAPDFLGRCIDATVEALQEAENKGTEVAFREVAARAWWSMLQSRTTIAKTYPRRLKEAFENGEQDSQVSTLAELSDSSMLALVDDNSVNEGLESARLLQSLLPVVEQSLAALDARMSSLIGLDTVKADKNPLRPSVFVRVLRDLMSDMEQDSEVRALWLQQIGPSLGRELNKLYEKLALTLQKANVGEASYRVRLVADPQASRPPTPPSRDMLDFDLGGEGNSVAGSLGGGGYPGGGGAGGYGAGGGVQDTGFGGPGGGFGGGVAGSQYGGLGPGEGDAMPSMQALGCERSQVNHNIFHDFMKGGDQRFEQALTDEYYHQVQQDLARIQANNDLPMLDDVVLAEERTQYQNMAAVDRPARMVGVGTQLSKDQWGEFAAPNERSRMLLEFKQQATKVAQAIGLDMVRKLVNQVARDNLLLAPVREAVVAMEPALLRLALSDPRYFDEDENPARRLIETFAERSFKYNDEFSEEFEEEFLEPVQDAVKNLNQQQAETPEAFGEVLKDLKDRWESQDKAEKSAEEKRLEAIRHAEERQALADQIAWDMSLRPDVFNAPGVVLDFLYQTWSLVIAEAKLRDGSEDPDPGGYRKIVSDLLWSTKKDVTMRRPKQLFMLVPGMLKKVREGLEMLGKSGDETKPFFDALLRLHEPVLGLRRAKARTDGITSSMSPLIELPSGPAPLDASLPATPEQQKPKAAAQPWMAAKEKESAGFEEVAQSAPAPLEDMTESQMQSLPAAADDGIDAGALAETLRSSKDKDVVSAGDGINVKALMRGLRKGDWVDLLSKGKWYRAKLVWASTHGSLFMFTSRGGRGHSMTKRSLEKLLSERHVRVVEAHEVVQRALDAVAAGEDASAQEEDPASVM